MVHPISLSIAVLVSFASVSPALAKIEVHGHRGARAMRPENTLPAFEYAIEAGADVLEFDLTVTKDDQILVTHDLEINPEICLAPGGKKIEGKHGPAIRSLTLAEAQAYDCGTLINSKFPKQTPVPGTRMPTLAQVFQMVKDSKNPNAARVQFNIETKIVPTRPDLSPEPAPFVRQILAIVDHFGMRNRVILQSFDHRTLVEAKKIAPKLRTSALVSDNFMADWVGLARAARADFISPDSDWIDRPTVDKLHAAGVKVAPWTVNDAEGWDRMVKLGADAVITDDPAGLITYLKAKGLR